MKLLYLLSFVGLALANVEMFDQPPEGHCNAIYHCPLKKEYRDAGMKLSEEDDKKLYSKYKECCSFYGHCGTTDEYCQIGCQSGDCDQKFVQVTQRLITCSTYSLLGKCDEYCTCPEGQCCSKYGYCGKGEKYCGTSEPDKTTDEEAKETPKVKGRCGSGYGNCPDGLCCSKYGWCGTTSEYCDSGCQEKYGKCGKESDTHGKYGKCGKNYGKCPKDLCCSEYGYCGSTSAYCSKKQGCQSEFGRCD